MSEARGSRHSDTMPLPTGHHSAAAPLSCLRGFLIASLLLVLVIVPPAAGQSETGVASVLAPFIRLIGTDSSLGLSEAHPDSVLVDLGTPADGIESALDSLQHLIPFEVGTNKYRDCSDGSTLGAVVSRARCALVEYQLYVGFGTIVVRHSTAEATIVVARRATGPVRGRGTREAIASTLGKAVRRRTLPSLAVSFRTYVMRLTLTENGEWGGGTVVSPTPANRRTPNSTGQTSS